VEVFGMLRESRKDLTIRSSREGQLIFGVLALEKTSSYPSR
jgi:hypothetical protein